MVLVGLVASLIANYFQISSIISLLTWGIVLTAAYLLVAWEFGLKQLERIIVESFIPLKIRNALHREAKCIDE